MLTQGRLGKNDKNGNGTDNGNDKNKTEDISPVTNNPTTDDSIEGVWGFVLGLAYGLQYDANKPGACYVSIESEVEALVQIWELMRVSYLPSTWSSIFQASMDTVDLGSSIFANCQVEKLINTINGLFTMQGSSQIMSRLGGALINVIPNLV